MDSPVNGPSGFTPGPKANTQLISELTMESGDLEGRKADLEREERPHAQELKPYQWRWWQRHQGKRDNS